MARILFALCLGLLLTAAPLMAQQVSQRSIPTAEWVARSLRRMDEKGLLVGFDQMGHRRPGPLGRYEIAAAIHVAYTNVKTIVSGLQDRIDGLKQMADSSIESIRLELDELKADLASIDHLSEDVDDLLKLARWVQTELIDLGADFFAIERDLLDLATRTTCQDQIPPEDAAGEGEGQTQTKPSVRL